jgi:diguanylate cyclase (GGDEF)-like protein
MALLRERKGIPAGDTSWDVELDAMPPIDKAREALIAETGDVALADRMISLLGDCGVLASAGASAKVSSPASGLSSLVKNLMGIGDAFSLGIMNGILRHGMDFDTAADHARDMVAKIAKSGSSDAYSIEVLSGMVDELYEAARTDKLTGLLMRAAFEKEYLRMQEGVNALVLIDCDHFKRVNDTHGHDAGDAVLRSVAELIKHGVRAVDLACRWGGDEFVILLPRAALEDAQTVAERLRMAAAAADLMGVTLSIGVALTSRDEPLATALQRADIAMYTAKRSGKNAVVSA